MKPSLETKIRELFVNYDQNEEFQLITELLFLISDHLRTNMGYIQTGTNLRATIAELMGARE